MMFYLLFIKRGIKYYIFLYFSLSKSLTTLDALETIANKDDTDFDFSDDSNDEYFNIDKLYEVFSESENEATKESIILLMVQFTKPTVIK